MRIESDQFSVENEVAPKRSERLHDPWEAFVEHFHIARKQCDFCVTFHGDAAIAIEYGFMKPGNNSRNMFYRLPSSGLIQILWALHCPRFIVTSSSVLTSDTSILNRSGLAFLLYSFFMMLLSHRTFPSPTYLELAFALFAVA